VDPCVGRVFSFGEIGSAHQLMSDNVHTGGNMVALVGVPTTGTKGLPE